MLIKNNNNTHKGGYLSFIYNSWKLQMTYSSISKWEVI